MRIVNNPSILLYPGWVLVVFLSVHIFSISILSNPDGNQINGSSYLNNDGAEPDIADVYWKAKRKYLIVVTATKVANPAANLLFSKVDGQVVAERFERFGYKVLSVTSGEEVTRDNLTHVLQNIGASSDAIVVVYYTGHAFPADSDLWLQLYGKFWGSGYGMSMSHLITEVRRGFEGALVLIVDSCFSGESTQIDLPLKSLKNTIIVTSSDKSQESTILTDGSASAFSHFVVRALSDDWEKADIYPDGILEYSEFEGYLTIQLANAKIEGLINIEMKPRFLNNSPGIFLAFDEKKVRDWNTLPRQLLKAHPVIAALYEEINLREKSELIAKSGPSKGRPSSAEVKAIAPLLNNGSGQFLNGLTAIIEGRFDDAIYLLKDFEGKEEGNDKEEVYLALALAQRFAGKRNDSITTYTRGINNVGETAALVKEASFVQLRDRRYTTSEIQFATFLTLLDDPSSRFTIDKAETFKAYIDLLTLTDQTKIKEKLIQSNDQNLLK